MFINGYSQPGATENTRLVGTDAKLLIELDGSNAGQAGTNGLSIESSNVTVRGLVINDFSGAGIEIRDATGVKIEGNFIGTYPSGTQDRSNYESGVDIFSSSFSGANNNVIGGAPRTAHNLISGNGSTGIDIFNAPDKKVLGNLIGTSKDGKSALGNGTVGVFIINGDSNTVGDTVLGMADTIAFNGADGVAVFGGAFGTRILSNSIFSNDGLGINLLGIDGPDPNDARDADTGANNLQNKPVISSTKTSSSGTTTIRGQLSSTRVQNFTIQFFSNPKGENEGKKFLGEKEVTTGSEGKASFSFKGKVRKGVMTATATNEATGDTSEFSAPRRVVTQ